MLAPPIPPLDEPPNWARLPIVENGEPLIALEPAPQLRGRSMYAEQNIPGAEQTVWVRAGVHARLTRAAQSLPSGVALVVFDGFRPLVVQRYLYDTFTAEACANRPDMTGDALKSYVGQFVATPTADPACPPPHRTGGAVDVYLVDMETGDDLPMGTLPDAIAEATHTRYFEENPQSPFAENRRLLFWAMTQAGFTNYRGEWWHYDFGNQRWANCTGQPSAIYGIAATGDTIPEPA